jgi:hypothetical protein
MWPGVNPKINAPSHVLLSDPETNPPILNGMSQIELQFQSPGQLMGLRTLQQNPRFLTAQLVSQTLMKQGKLHYCMR